MNNRVVIIGMECIYPGAHSYEELWENVCSGRKAFRKIPKERLGLEYFGEGEDQIIQKLAGVIKDYKFDRVKYKISEQIFSSADMSHWLALDVATRALEDAQILLRDDLFDRLKENGGVYVGNTLTGEITRANQLRLRWPFFERVLKEQLEKTEWKKDQKSIFISQLKKKFKSFFPEIIEDSLAGGLSNTIAGRISNYHDLRGGGYSVDGACSSSLLAVSTAYKSIQTGDVKWALAGGVDVSLDPFELVGFSRAGALSKNSMDVFSNISKGFIPGEGCGFVVLMDEQLALDLNLEVYAIINGIGISSDGKGGLTRPKIETQERAILNSYPGETLAKLKYIETHGTGTKLGDNIELSALANVAEKVNNKFYIGAIKNFIGHTKAAAGIVGLIKSILIVKQKIIPSQHFYGKKNDLLHTSQYLEIPKDHIAIEDEDFVVGVSSFGFGGINVHVSLNNNPTAAPFNVPLRRKDTNTSEIFLFSKRTLKLLQEHVIEILGYLSCLSHSEFSDLSYYLFNKIVDGANDNHRLAIVANSIEQLHKRLELWLKNSQQDKFWGNDIYYQSGKKQNRIGFVFPGQGGKQHCDETFFVEKFSFLKEVQSKFVDTNDSSGLSQSEIVKNSVLALNILEYLGVKSEISIGHSLGELSALYWANSIDLETLSKVVTEREYIMDVYGSPQGRMYMIPQSEKIVKNLINGAPFSIACVNSSTHVVISGLKEAFEKFKIQLKNKSIPYVKLPVNRGFHSPLMRQGVKKFEEYFEEIDIKPPLTDLYSPTFLSVLDNSNQVKKMLLAQFTKPVRFYDAIKEIDDKVDLWIEVGAEENLKEVIKFTSKKTVISTNLSTKLNGILNVSAGIFAIGGNIDLEKLFEGRFFKEIKIPFQPIFISNPCERENNIELESRENITNSKEIEEGNILLEFREFVADQLGLPVQTILSSSRMLDDLHLNSIMVGNLMAKYGVEYEHDISLTPAEYSNATIEEIADSFKVTSSSIYVSNTQKTPIYDWVGTFIIDWDEVININSQDDNSFDEKNWEVFSCMGESDIQGQNVLISSINLEEDEVLNLLEKLCSILQEQIPNALVFLENDSLVKGFAKSIYCEYPQVKVIHVQSLMSKISLKELQKLLNCTNDFWSVKINENTYEPYLKNIEINKSIPNQLEKGDLILVTGGAKGITAECALALQQKYNVTLLLLGRTPKDDSKLFNNLNRFQLLGVDYIYLECDITDTEQLETTIDAIKKNYGIPNVVLHGAGINIPTPTSLLSKKIIERTLAPKYLGLKNILLLLGENLDHVVTFGSIIAELGMEGNADYALANEWMTQYLENWGKNRQTRWLNIEWSVWSGTGMGDKLGVLERLRSKGIAPISIENGIKKFIDVFNSNYKGNIIISGRFGLPSTLKFNTPDFSYLRFIEDVKLYYPKQEIITGCRISSEQDLYLYDHIIDGSMVVPTVMWFENIFQALWILNEGKSEKYLLDSLELINPGLVLNKGLNTLLHIVKADIGYECRIYSTGNSNHLFLKAKLHRFKDENYNLSIGIPNIRNSYEANDLRDELYYNLLFHGAAFRAIDEIFYASPYEVLGSVRNTNCNWFYSDDSREFLTFSPDFHDAMLHIVQLCVPYYTLLPVSINQVWIAGREQVKVDTKIYLYAKEQRVEDDLHTYSVVLFDENSKILASYQNAVFRVVKEKNDNRIFTPNLAKIALDRLLINENFDSSRLSFGVNKYNSLKRPDGKPISNSGNHLSTSSIGDYYLSIESNFLIGCDIELVTTRSKMEWVKLLGNESFQFLELAHSNSQEENFDSFATRFWGIKETIRKSGMISPIKIEIKKELEPAIIIFNIAEFRGFSWRCYLEGGEEYIITVCEKRERKEKHFIYNHIVSFEETNLVGNVYFSNYIKWQGKCREAFLHQNAMHIKNENGKKEKVTSLLSDGRLALVTCSLDCKYLRELKAFDKVNVYLTLEYIVENRIGMSFIYKKVIESGEILVAKGKQEISCMERNDDGGLEEYRHSIPSELKKALIPYLKRHFE